MAAVERGVPDLSDVRAGFGGTLVPTNGLVPGSRIGPGTYPPLSSNVRRVCDVHYPKTDDVFKTLNP